MVTYKYFSENLFDIVKNYIEAFKIAERPRGLLITEHDDDGKKIKIEVGRTLFGKAPKKDREFVIDLLKLIRNVVKDPVLGKAINVRISDLIYDDNIIVIWIGNKEINMRISSEFFSDYTTIPEIIKLFENFDSKLSKFENLASNLKYDSIYFYKVKDDPSKLINVIKLVENLKEKATQAGLKVKERVYIWKKGGDEIKSSVFMVRWYPEMEKFIVEVSVSGDYFSNTMLLRKIELKDLPDLLNEIQVDHESRNNFLDKEIENEEIVKIVIPSIIKGL